MSVKNRCKDCFRESGLSANFGYDSETENKFHSIKSCDCPYNSPEEMMLDQDMGLKDPNWMRIAKDLVPEFKSNLSSCSNEEEEVRLFLKLLDFHTKNYKQSLELKNTESTELPDFVTDGKPKKPVRFDVFKKRFF